jgi:hypothetical protein
MDHQTELLIEEIKKLNQRIDQISTSGRLMIYNANPFKFAFFNFIAGVFHSLGTLLTTVVISAVVFYFISSLNIPQYFGKLMESSMSQINWQKIIPTTLPQQ